MLWHSNQQVRSVLRDVMTYVHQCQLYCAMRNCLSHMGISRVQLVTIFHVNFCRTPNGDFKSSFRAADSANCIRGAAPCLMKGCSAGIAAAPLRTQSMRSFRGCPPREWSTWRP